MLYELCALKHPVSTVESDHYHIIKKDSGQPGKTSNNSIHSQQLELFSDYLLILKNDY